MTKSIIWSMVGPGLVAHWAIIWGWKKRIIAVQAHSAASCRSGDLELAGGHALRDHLADDAGDALHMGDADVPVLLHRDLDHLVQLVIADIALGVHAVDGGEQLAASAAAPDRAVAAMRCASISTSPIRPRATAWWIAFFESKKR